MKVSFFENWVTFYPSQDDLERNSYLQQTGPITITVNQAMRALYCLMSDDGIITPVSDPLGAGTEWQTYPFVAGEAIHETIIADHARRAWANYLMNQLSDNKTTAA